MDDASADCQVNRFTQSVTDAIYELQDELRALMKRVEAIEAWIKHEDDRCTD